MKSTHPDLAPGADPELARLVAQVRDHPVRPPLAPRFDPVRKSAKTKAWRTRRQEGGGHVTNIVYSPAAWHAVQAMVAGDRTSGAISRAACELITRGAMLDDRSLEQARGILAAYPDMGTIEVAIEVAIAHLFAKIHEDQSYIISLPS